MYKLRDITSVILYTVFGEINPSTPAPCLFHGDRGHEFCVGFYFIASLLRVKQEGGMRTSIASPSTG